MTITFPMSLADDWPRPVSRKTSEEGVKKTFLFEPQVSLKDFSHRTQVFRAKWM